jgi:hypothetical protein
MDLLKLNSERAAILKWCFVTHKLVVRGYGPKTDGRTLPFKALKFTATSVANGR